MFSEGEGNNPNTHQKVSVLTTLAFFTTHEGFFKPVQVFSCAAGVVLLKYPNFAVIVSMSLTEKIP
jgi:hypothetical protein